MYLADSLLLILSESVKYLRKYPTGKKAACLMNWPHALVFMLR